MLLPYHCYNIVLKHVYLILYVYIFYFIFGSVHFTAGMSVQGVGMPNQLFIFFVHFVSWTMIANIANYREKPKKKIVFGATLM